MQFGLRAGI